MTAFVVMAVLVAAFIALVLMLPCRACRARRERLRAAYGRRRQTDAGADR
jgi:hypothetical protein